MSILRTRMHGIPVVIQTNEAGTVEGWIDDIQFVRTFDSDDDVPFELRSTFAQLQGQTFAVINALFAVISEYVESAPATEDDWWTLHQIARRDYLRHVAHGMPYTAR